jgi:hypothetical protein
MYKSAREVVALLAVAMLCGIAGCGLPYEVGQVSGTVSISGKPAGKIRVEFVPDAGLEGPASEAVTDENGKYELKLLSKASEAKSGALVGTHRVVLNDMQLAESETGRGVPIRLKPDYSSLSSTPLVETVQPGEQTIDIVIP